MAKKIIILFVLILATAIGIYYFLNSKNTVDDTKIVLYGNIDIREAQLAFNSSEHINKLLVQEGEHVKKGQLLATLHTELLEYELLQAQAKLIADQQKLKKLETGYRKEEIDKAKAQYRAAKAKEKAAIDNYHRLSPLLKKKLVSPEDVENAQASADVARAESQAVYQALVLLKSGFRKEDIAVAKAAVTGSEATVQLIQQKLDDTHLYAPDNGIIRDRILELGEMAFPQSPVMTLAFTNPVWVRAYLSEPDLGKIALGSPATIYTDSYPNKSYQGWVGYMSPTAEFTPKTVQTEQLRTRLVYSIRIYACNPQDELRLGMPVTVHLAADIPPSAQASATSVCQ
ncbi:MAG: efflux RND transporter periplasmic adaptor subunit [Methylophaga sp.]|nr:efflux RND transporter periplasmic adaptor subunit [Methylophaga sp.]